MLYTFRGEGLHREFQNTVITVNVTKVTKQYKAT